MIPVPEAIRIVLRETGRILLDNDSKGITETQTILSDAPWSDILGSVLHEDVIMAEPGYPGYNASVMDGYCIRSTEVDASNATGSAFTHRVVDKVYAGDESAPTKDSISDSTLPVAYYITTGAVVPESFDCVVPIEECHLSTDKKYVQIQSSAVIQQNKWIRPIGCDIPAGSVVLPRGQQIDPVALGLLKQSGAQSLNVKKKINVGVLSTGNELILGSATNANQHGKIPDVNRPILLSVLDSFGIANVVDLGTERDDDVLALARTIDSALERLDVIITTGGISMGETDIVEDVLVNHCGGSLHFGRMHMKPGTIWIIPKASKTEFPPLTIVVASIGKPTTFVTIPKGNRARLVFAMPGNPVSGFVCTQLLVKPCLDLLFNGIGEAITVKRDNAESELVSIVDNATIHPEIMGRLAHDIKLDFVRPEYHRVTIDMLPDGTPEVASTGVQRSSRLMSLRDAMGLLVLPVGHDSKPMALKGEAYPVLITGDSIRYARGTKLKESMHLAPKKKQLRVAVVEVVRKEMAINGDSSDGGQIIDALSGSNSGSAALVSKRSFSDDLDKLYTFCVDSNGADVIVVSCSLYPGSFQYHLDVSSTLRSRLTKVAGALSLQARQGAASQNPAASIFEAIVGYAPEKQGAMLICLPDKGLMGGLSNVRGLLKHALNVARGRPHNHHHKK